MIRLAHPPYCLVQLVLPLFFALPSMTQAADGIEELGTLGGSYSAAWGVSADGKVMVGSSYTAGDTSSRAFRRESGSSMVDLGTLGGTNSWAFGVSADGSVVAGEANVAGDSALHAFRWQSGSMVDLGTLGGTNSSAFGISADGAVVVGESDTTGDASVHAFRWQGGMVDLGTLGGTNSSAYGISANGTVVVGYSDTTGDVNRHAFRWQSGTGMADLGTLGGSMSIAWGVSGNGSVVVGWAYTPGDANARAFRWESHTGMVDLGSLGGNISIASAASADGNVVVGSANTPGDATFRAFRWTQAIGIQSVDDWLRAAGITVPTDITKEALATNQNGSVVVGVLDNGHAFIARVDPIGSGLVTLEDVRKSLSDSVRGGNAVLESGRLVLQGAHSRPLLRRANEGRSTFWLAGDWGRDDHGARDGDLGLAEIGIGRNFGPAQLNLSVGQTWAKQAWALDGQAKADGSYLLAEALIPVRGKLWAVLGGYYHWGDADLRRGYLNVAAPAYSSGSAAARAWGLRARLEWDRAFNLAGAVVSPYVDASYGETTLAAYGETSGPFPARFEARKEKMSELRLGVNATQPLAENTRLVTILEAAHRFEKVGASTSVDLVGLGSVRLDGEENQRDWLRIGVGLEGIVVGGHASFTVNATSRGEVPAYWLAANWQRSF